MARGGQSEQSESVMACVALAAPPLCTLENVMNCPSPRKKSTFFLIRLPLTNVPFAELVNNEEGVWHEKRARSDGCGAREGCVSSRVAQDDARNAGARLGVVGTYGTVGARNERNRNQNVRLRPSARGWSAV